jgi:hypothetical protein
MIPVTERMIAAAIIAEAHHPPGADQNTMMRAQMRASLTAALAVAESPDESPEERLAREIGEKLLELVGTVVAARLLDDVTGGAA